MPLHFHESRETIEILQRVVNQLDERDGTICADELWEGAK